MKNIRENCMAFFQNDEIKREIFNFVRPVVNIVYNEIYIYVWFICIYIVLLLVITLANLFILLKISGQKWFWSKEVINTIFEKENSIHDKKYGSFPMFPEYFV